MTDDITLRSPAADELRALMQPLVVAFGSDFSEGEFEAERPLLEPERFVSAFAGEERIGAAGAFSLRLTVPGGEVAASGITAIGVRPDHTRRGVMRKMMTWLLDDARRRGEPVAVLWASEAAIYQRFGFGSGSLQSTFEVDRSRIAFQSPIPPRDGVRIEMIGIEEAAGRFPPIYEAMRRQVPGSLDRPDARWRGLVLADEEWTRRGGGPAFRAVLEVDGEDRGYVLYRMNQEWDERGPKYGLRVMDLVGLDPEAEQRLWQWICGIDLVGTVKHWRGPVPHPLALWVQEPRRLGLTVFDGLWLRILDVAGALAGRTYVGEGSLALEVTDALIDSNAGRWQLMVRADGSADVAPTSAEPDLTLDVAALASVYLGAYRFADLARAGLVREGRPGALLAADVLFTTSRAPFCNTMF